MATLRLRLDGFTASASHRSDLTTQVIAVIRLSASTALRRAGLRAGRVPRRCRWLRARDAKPQRSAERVGEHVQPGRQSASGTPQRLIIAPPFQSPPAGERERWCVDHQILIVAIHRQRLEQPAPRRQHGTSGETPMHRLPLAVAFRQIAPMGARAQHHKHPFTNSRLSEPVRPGSAVLPGTEGNPGPLRPRLNSYA